MTMPILAFGMINYSFPLLVHRGPIQGCEGSQCFTLGPVLWKERATSILNFISTLTVKFCVVLCMDTKL